MTRTKELGRFTWTLLYHMAIENQEAFWRQVRQGACIKSLMVRSILAPGWMQEGQDSGVNRFVRGGRENYSAVEAPVLDLLGGLSRRDLGQWPECFELQELVVGESLEGATEIGIRLAGIRVGALDEGFAV